MDFSPQHLRMALIYMGVLLLSICVHEFGHAFVADKLGDDTPRRQGRVSLNPLVHADPIGTLVFPLIGIMYSGQPGFGWGKPVQTRPINYTRRFHMRTGHMFVAIAGPAMNLLFGTLIAILHVALLKTEVISIGGLASDTFFYAVQLNFILFFFNLIPAPPLDGGAVLEGLLPRRLVPEYQKIAVFGPFVLMAVILIPQLSHVFVVPAVFVRDHLYNGLATLFGV